MVCIAKALGGCSSCAYTEWDVAPHLFDMTTHAKCGERSTIARQPVAHSRGNAAPGRASIVSSH